MARSGDRATTSGAVRRPCHNDAVLRTLLVVARSPDRATGPTEGLRIKGDLRSAEWHGQETVPQRVARSGDRATTMLSCVLCLLWHGLLTVPPARPKVSV